MKGNEKDGSGYGGIAARMKRWREKRGKRRSALIR